jgi:hypothetical protein
MSLDDYLAVIEVNQVGRFSMRGGAVDGGGRRIDRGISSINGLVGYPAMGYPRAILRSGHDQGRGRRLARGIERIDPPRRSTPRWCGLRVWTCPPPTSGDVLIRCAGGQPIGMALALFAPDRSSCGLGFLADGGMSPAPRFLRTGAPPRCIDARCRRPRHRSRPSRRRALPMPRSPGYRPVGGALPRALRSRVTRARRATSSTARLRGTAVGLDPDTVVSPPGTRSLPRIRPRGARCSAGGRRGLVLARPGHHATRGRASA